MRAAPGLGLLTDVVLQPAQLEVWGDPVSHSRSPQLHTAAYRALGLRWTYERRRVAEAEFARELAHAAARVRGLSLTMPLKGAAFAAAATRNRDAELTGAVNTLLFAGAAWHGVNTDVGGMVRDLADHGMDGIAEARIVGAGATGTSALVALAEFGAGAVHIVARRPGAARPLADLGERLGVRVTVVPDTAEVHAPLPLTIATLPGDARVTDATADALAASGGVLYDVVYGSWPTALAAAWERVGGTAVSGEGMLLAQAVLQVRVFVTGEVSEPLPGEDAVIAAMRDAVMGD